ncbi:MAG: VWA domain-containing protein [Vulcanimicrobiota bacterium]
MSLNQVDICFVIDTTGSMGPFLASAQAELVRLMEGLGSTAGLDMQFALVEYRDHPPQEQSFITKCYPLTSNRQALQKVIDQLKASGGGDAPEAVYRGLHDGCLETAWREHSSRYVILVGDAPPHGLGMRGDHWPDGCPSGLDTRQVTAIAEETRATLFALVIGPSPYTEKAFAALARGTGGRCYRVSAANEVLAKLVDILTEEFSHLELDQKVLTRVQQLECLDPGELACDDFSRFQAAGALARLGKRQLLGRF